MKNNRRDSTKNENARCPIDGCGVPCTDDYRMSVHIKGAHLKNGSELTEEFIKQIQKGLEKDFSKRLLERLETNEPEVTVADEVTVEDDKSAVPEENYDLKRYLNDAPYICREERQFAFYLAGKIKEGFYAQKIFGCDKKDIEILDVFYEVAIMRDFLHEYGKIFNNKYIPYLHKKLKQLNIATTEYTLPKEEDPERIKHANHWTAPHPLAQWMMNAKPDIAVLYKKKEKLYLMFIECKYTSGQDTYKKNGFTLKQVETQELILEFICNYLSMNYCGETIYKDKVILIRFIVNGEEKDNDEEKQIKISTLRCNSCTSPSTAALTR